MKEARTQYPFVEKIEVAGDQLVAKVNELVRDINARRVVIKDQRGKDLPLNVSVVAGGLLTVATPVLAAVGALAAVVARVQLEIERTDVPAEEADDEPEFDGGDTAVTDAESAYQEDPFDPEPADVDDDAATADSDEPQDPSTTI